QGGEDAEHEVQHTQQDFPCDAHRQTSCAKGNAPCCSHHCGQYAPHSLSDVVQCHSHIFQFLDCCYLSCSDGEVGSSPFSFRLSVCPMSPCDVFRPRTGRFRFRGKSKGQGSRFSKFFRQNTT